MLQLKRSLLAFAGLSVICGLIYPLAVTVISQAVFLEQSNGSMIINGKQIMGSRLIGQQFTSPKYFHGRPSASDPPYDASNSGGSNLGPTSAKLLSQVQSRVSRIREENGLPADAAIPADLVLTSASGLDPHISPLSAALQVKRIAGERKMPESDVERLIHQNTEYPLLGMWGKEHVNVLQLNLALDNAFNGRR
ncbi:MAG: potassium-transporting ATPase subunit C [Deltaproteobacteria bacterium HGW-Deltaproteobacteria-13]|jgi:K+-transporting ATPase ATPase C chain|nr:MAG: potassium-transporting ATPase subunit C [Deltaproteobacteria bacterium HGW-Deltaproteobacteria-13]